MDVVSSTPVTLWVDFEAPQGLVIPDVDTVFFSLYDGSGAPLAVQQALTPEAEASGVSIPIHAIHNVLLPGRLFGRRQVLLTFEAGGQSYQKRLSYRIVELPPYAATAEDVRNYLALNEDELRDGEVDLYGAYVALSTQAGDEPLRAALGSGTYSEIRAERAIVLTAAASLFPSLRYRIAQAKTDGSLKFERLKDTTAFDGLVAATTDELGKILEEITGVVPDTTSIPTLLLFTTITTDPVTGSAPASAAGG